MTLRTSIIFTRFVRGVAGVAISLGAEPSSAIIREVASINNTPLSEDAGETYHKHTHETIQHGPVSKTPWVLASTTELQHLDLCKSFCSSHGERASEVIEYEWLQYKRILRPTSTNKWKAVKMDDNTFFHKLYSLDECDDDWGPAMGIGSAKKSSPTADADQQVKQEYMRAVFKPESYYIIPVARADVCCQTERLSNSRKTVFSSCSCRAWLYPSQAGSDNW
jgi:hypothetical protein